MPGCAIYFIKVACIQNCQMISKPHATKLDIYIINEVKALRQEHEMTQNDLSQALNMADSFVSNVESLKRREKYNVNHLNQLAKIFKCSPRDFLPEKPI